MADRGCGRSNGWVSAASQKRKVRREPAAARKDFSGTPLTSPHEEVSGRGGKNRARFLSASHRENRSGVDDGRSSFGGQAESRGRGRGHVRPGRDDTCGLVPGAVTERSSAALARDGHEAKP